ncbi:MAG: hypothetical protein II956_09675 [Bacteroidales bacterium]|nr:hypothetical protein [Bacteroidales bacterium]
MKKTSIILLIVFLIIGCRENNGIYQQLVKVDSLLHKNLVDSANSILKEIEPKSKEDSAYFFVLRAQCDYRLHIVTNDFNKINYCIKYYEKHSDNIKLANAYYYKALIFAQKDSLPQEVFLLLKKSEQLAEKTSDNDLKNKICSALAYVNYIKNQPEETLKYAQKEYFYAKKLNCRRDIAYALIRLTIAHNALNQNDSAEYYIMQCKALAKDVDNNDKAFIYTLLGCCFKDENSEAALKYFYTSLKYKKLPKTYKNLSEIYYAKNDTQNWKKYCDSALIDAMYDEKIEILSNIAQKNYDNKNFAAYKQTNDEIIKTMQDLYNHEKENYTLEVQKKFDFEKQKSEFDKKILLLVGAISILIALCSVIYLLYRQKLHNIQKLENDNAELYAKQEELNSLINNYNEQIAFLKKQKNELTSESDNWSSVVLEYENMIVQLENKINVLNKQNMQLLEIGEKIFKTMENNQSISGFKENWANCVFYFEFTYPDKTTIFTPYSNLNIGNKIFIIADENLKKNDNDLSKIFDISESTVRSRRTKMKEKLK